MVASSTPSWASPSHPIAQRERQAWQRRWPWQVARIGCLPATVLVLLVPSACGIVFALQEFASDPALFLLTVFFGIGVAQFVLAAFTGLLALIGGALTVAPERAQGNWELLRLTPFTPEQIVAAKVAALLRQLAPLMAGVIIMRVLLAFALIVILLLFLIFDGTNGTPASLLMVLRELFVLAPSETTLGLTATLVLGPVSAVAWLATLIWRVVQNAIVGTLASSFTRSASAAIAVAVALQYGTNIVIGGIVQQIVAASTLVIFGASSTAALNPLAPYLLVGANGVAAIAISLGLTAALLLVLRQRLVDLPN